MTTHYECDVCGSMTTATKNVASAGYWHSVFEESLDLEPNGHVCSECIERAKKAIEEEFE